MMQEVPFNGSVFSTIIAIFRCDLCRLLDRRWINRRDRVLSLGRMGTISSGPQA